MDKYIEQKHQQGGANEVDPEDAPRARIFDNLFGIAGAGGANQQNRVAIVKVFILSLIVTLWFYWVASVHILCIDFPLQVWLKTSMAKMEFMPTFVHFVALWWTLLPAIMYLGKIQARDLDLQESIKSMGLGYLLMNYAMIYIPSLSYTAWKIVTTEALTLRDVDVAGPGYFPIAWVFSFIVFAIYRSLNNVIKFYDYIGQQIKTEKYVRGRAIVNDDEDVSEEERL